MIVASLFGVPAGLEVHRIAIGEESQIKFEDSWIDISLKDVLLTGNEDIYRVFRLNVSGKILTWIGLYRPAKEIGPNRGGGFYGAGLWLIDASVSSKVVHEVIVNLADQIRDLAMHNGKFLKKIADIRSLIVPPPQVALLVSSRQKLTAGVTLKDKDGGLAFISDSKNVLEVIDWAQNSSTARFYSQVIAAPSNQFVKQQSEFLKGFELFGSVFAAVEHAYNSNSQTLITTKEQLKLVTDQLRNKEAELAEKIDELSSKDVELSSVRTDLGKLNENLKNKTIAFNNVNEELIKEKNSVKEFQREIKNLESLVNNKIDEQRAIKTPVPYVSSLNSAGGGYSPGVSTLNRTNKPVGFSNMYESEKPRKFFHFLNFKVAAWILCIGLIALICYLGFPCLKKKFVQGIFSNTPTSENILSCSFLKNGFIIKSIAIKTDVNINNYMSNLAPRIL